MSREIKFRAWGENIKEYLSANGKTPLPLTLKMLAEGCVYDPDLWEFEQYTSLKDKNGKEIYEGDIIQCHLSPISSIIFTGVVEFRPGCIMFKNFADGGSYAFNFLGAIEAVIGNIHENPELLENKNGRN